jgi:hypothetical protein
MCEIRRPGLTKASGLAWLKSVRKKRMCYGGLFWPEAKMYINAIRYSELSSNENIDSVAAESAWNLLTVNKIKL